MRSKRILRMLTSFLAVVLCTTAFSVTAYAGGGENTDEPPTEEITAQALTPEGNMTLVDDLYGEETGDKQFITVVSRNGHYFYIIIDRADEGENTVHFLNQVDETDLMALMEEEQGAAKPVVCICTDKCQAGEVNPSCEICMKNMSECMGKDPEPVEPAEPEEPAEEKSNGGVVAAVLLLLAVGGGAAAYFFVLKPKQGKKMPANLDDFDLGEEEEYLTEDNETEDNG